MRLASGLAGPSKSASYNWLNLMQKRIEEKHYKIVEICKNTGKKFKGKVLVFPNES